MEAPIPLEAPVTTATLPVSFLVFVDMIFLFFEVLVGEAEDSRVPVNTSSWPAINHQRSCYRSQLNPSDRSVPPVTRAAETRKNWGYAQLAILGPIAGQLTTCELISRVLCSAIFLHVKGGCD